MEKNSIISLEKYLQIYNKNPEDLTKEDFELLGEYNKQLIAEYPWLEPRNVWSYKKITQCTEGKEKGYWPDDPDTYPEYNYEYTLLDDMPEGWRIAFGDQMQKEIKEALLAAQAKDPEGGYKESWVTTNYDSDRILPYIEGYAVNQIKEKYGILHWYDNGGPDTLHQIIRKYENLSAKTCICCGKPAKYMTTSWISPFCEDCINSDYVSYVTIEEYNKE